jgi:hypothetical protein
VKRVRLVRLVVVLFLVVFLVSAVWAQPRPVAVVTEESEWMKIVRGDESLRVISWTEAMRIDPGSFRGFLFFWQEARKREEFPELAKKLLLRRCPLVFLGPLPRNDPVLRKIEIDGNNLGSQMDRLPHRLFPAFSVLVRMTVEYSPLLGFGITEIGMRRGVDIDYVVEINRATYLLRGCEDR